MMTKAVATTTAGVRGAFWDTAQLPESTQFESAVVACADGAMYQGTLAFCLVLTTVDGFDASSIVYVASC